MTDNIEFLRVPQLPIMPYFPRCADCGHTKIEHDFPSGACGICVECVDFAAPDRNAD